MRATTPGARGPVQLFTQKLKFKKLLMHVDECTRYQNIMEQFKVAYLIILVNFGEKLYQDC